MSEKKQATNVRPWGNKFKAHVHYQLKQYYVGNFDTVEEAVAAQKKFRKDNNMPEPKRGRPFRNTAIVLLVSLLFYRCEHKGIVVDKLYVSGCWTAEIGYKGLGYREVTKWKDKRFYFVLRSGSELDTVEVSTFAWNHYKKNSYFSTEFEN